MLRTFAQGPGQQRMSAQGVLCWLARAAYEVMRMSCLWACVSGVGDSLQRCVLECWGDAWESRQAYPGERGKLVASLGLDYEERSWPTLCKLVGSWSCFPDESEAG